MAKQVTGDQNETEAVKKFKKILSSPDNFYNKEDFPASESDDQAHRRCRSVEGAKKYCPVRWKALQSWFRDTRIVRSFIIWQAPRAGSMRRILRSDWLPERASWSDTARPGLPVSFPQIKFRQSFKRVHESFLSLKLLSAKVRRLFVISLSLWNQKMLISFKNTFCSKNRQIKHKSLF